MTQIEQIELMDYLSQMQGKDEFVAECLNVLNMLVMMDKVKLSDLVKALTLLKIRTEILLVDIKREVTNVKKVWSSEKDD